ncbi:MAG: DHH family phosphoesterase [Deltaproteobacteria bacterium]|jgi:nanoRNase/pAp phosphatase (c-di-AMP/oligoRNAs hydrolase)|nr:DHH family phosphoesterase [Deltaproteobacteria bacterium]
MTISNTEKLRRFYDQFSYDDHVLIIINADPDSIASAMAVKRLLWRRVSNVTISNINVIKRPDNIAMIRLLDVSLVPVKDIVKDGFTRFVIVDSQPEHDELFFPFTMDVIIDHHPDTGVKASFVDIRPKYGATASIMTEYVRAAKIKPSKKLASGLFYAIKTDTDNFVRQTLIEDVRAFQFLYRHANLNLVSKIERSELKLSFLKYFEIALSNKRIRKGRAFSHLGNVVNPDVCVLLADFFMKISSVDWSIVSGLSANKLILIFRNDGLRKDAGKVAKESFGALGSAGGHKSMARAEIHLEALKEEIDYKNDKKLIKWIIHRIEKRTGKK